MPKQTNQWGISTSGITEVHGRNDLETFRRRLEKEYFANVFIRKFECDDFRSDLVVELQINLNLVEFLCHIQKRNVGQLARQGNNNLTDNSLSVALQELRAKNSCKMNLEELTFFFTDSEITIKGIYENSIEEQLGNLYDALETHFIHITDDRSNVPTEIFIPVFEEKLEEKFKAGASLERDESSKRDYFNFWGIYFSHNDDAVIYDLGKRSIISGDLYMLD